MNIAPGPVAHTKWEIEEAAYKLRARGETALFDVIILALEQTDAAEGPGESIRAAVVLTDGQANTVTVRLDELVTVETRAETDITRWDGYAGSEAVDEHNVRRPASAVIGTGTRADLDNEVQVFFVAIGEDADLEVGRILAEATRAEFARAPEEDLAKVIEEFRTTSTLTRFHPSCWPPMAAAVRSNGTAKPHSQSCNSPPAIAPTRTAASPPVEITPSVLTADRAPRITPLKIYPCGTSPTGQFAFQG